MRIISKFHDYYDSAAAYGIDTAVVYVRETKEIQPREQYNKYRVTLFYDERKKIRHIYRKGYLGFCGRNYPFVIVTWYEGQEFHEERFWSIEDFTEFCNDIEPGWDKAWKRRGESWAHKRFREHYEGAPDNFDELFHEHQVPIFVVYGDGEFTLNPSLKDFEFYRIIDPYQTHQELAMFVGGVLNQPENRMVDISNEDKIAKHGYNKASFRTDRGTKPKRKRK